MLISAVSTSETTGILSIEFDKDAHEKLVINRFIDSLNANREVVLNGVNYLEEFFSDFESVITLFGEWGNEQGDFCRFLDYIKLTKTVERFRFYKYFNNNNSTIRAIEKLQNKWCSLYYALSKIPGYNNPQYISLVRNCVNEIPALEIDYFNTLLNSVNKWRNKQ